MPSFDNEPMFGGSKTGKKVQSIDGKQVSLEDFIAFSLYASSYNECNADVRKEIDKRVRQKGMRCART
jgi:hypothetical protein